MLLPASPRPASAVPHTLDLSERGDPPFWEMLSYLVTHKISRTVVLSAHQLTLYVREGKIEAVSGYRRLGDILIQHGWVEAREVDLALASPQHLGQYFLLQRRISSLQLRTALRQQVREALDYLLTQSELSYALAPTQVLPVPTASVEGSDFLAQILDRQPLALGTVYQLARIEQDITLSPRSWQLLRVINGRRALSRVIQVSGLPPKEADEAVRTLIQSGAVEQTNLLSLRFIVPKRLPLDSTKHPPGNLRANLFLKQVDGQQNVWEIQATLNLPADETITILLSLYRDRLIEVVQGQQEFDQILHTY